jgi:tetratricopeptide (TPR) repeat protein
MTVLGRDKILDDIQTYVNDARCKTPLVILGSTGAGKSAVMARSVAITLKNESLNAISRNGKTSWILFYHFVGAVPGSNDLGHVLQRLLKKLGLLKDNIPPVMDCLILEVHRVLSSPLTTPCILFFDGLDELNNEKVTDRLLWLPEELPPNIRCILSLTNQTQCHKSLTDRKRPPRELFCGPLSIRARNAIVTEMFANYKERLNDEQLLRLLSKDSSGNPLWLVTACQELRAHRDFKTLQGKIKELSNDLPILLQQILERLENKNFGELMIATLCLLECSRHGLLESELLLLLGNENDLVPSRDGWLKSHPRVDGLESSYESSLEVDVLAMMLDDKVSMTDTNPRPSNWSVPQAVDLGIDVGEGTGVVSNTTMQSLQASKWLTVCQGLRQFLRPFGDSEEGRFDFCHRMMREAVRQRYFKSKDKGYTNYQYTWWHGKLAGFFESSDDMDRRSEELPYHLERLLDHSRLAACLVEWQMFDRLFEEQYSVNLLHSWRKAGGYKAACSCYLKALQNLRESDVPLEEVALYQYKVAKFLCQAGSYDAAYKLLSETLEVEEKELGARPEQMADLLFLMADILSEREKLVVFISEETVKQSCQIIDYTKRSIVLRRQLASQNHERKLALTLLLHSFHLSSIVQQEMDTKDITVQQALDQGKQCLKEAMQIFDKQGDKEKLADCYMTLGFLQQSGTPDEFECYEKALKLCMESVGRNHVLTSRLYANLGNYYESSGQIEKAYGCFVEWAAISTEVLGQFHPKTSCAHEILSEPRYVAIEKRRKEEKKKNSNTASCQCLAR